MGCHKHSKSLAKVTGYKYAIPPCRSGACKNQRESDLKAALHVHGPLSVCVNANTWDTYTHGIYSEKCPGASDDLDHCVQLVGYDTTGSQPYWKVRNSWAADWGEKGYIRLPMGENACGIADEAMFVTASAATAVVV